MEKMVRVSGDEGGDDLFSCSRSVWVNGPVIVGAGPSGLAVASCLRQQGVPFVILERADCIASLWQHRTYDRLRLHLPKRFCQLPNLPFPDTFPEYPSKDQFVSYLESYAAHFHIRPHFNESVLSAKYDEACRLWRVRTSPAGGAPREIEYICQWLVAATGENAESVVPEIDGLEDFDGEILHACDYKTGKRFQGKRVLVVGCGNSGMELSLDLCNHNSKPSMVVRSSVHVLPREIFGKSTFELAVLMMGWLPLRLVDKIMLILAWLLLGNIETLGLKRPGRGPLELKNTLGKTPVLDIGALEKIRSGDIKVVPGIKKISTHGAELVDGGWVDADSIVLATGYKSNVPTWLKEDEFFSDNGFPKAPFPNGWKGKAGLYAVGFTRRGLSGAASDAINVAQDIGKVWRDDTKQKELTTPAISAAFRSFSRLLPSIICKQD